MELFQRGSYEFARMEHAERLREAERFRRAHEARQTAGRRTAAPRERRFFFFRIAFTRPSQA